jgi:large repetitive protein
MKDTLSIAGKELKFAPIEVLITNQNFCTRIPMNRSKACMRLAISLLVVLFSLKTTAINAKNTHTMRVSATNLVDSIYLYATRPTANVGDLVTVEVTTGGFTDVERFVLPMNWTPSLLQFQSISAITPSLPNFNLTNFDLASAASGTLLINWSDVPSSIPDGTTFFKITFRVLNYGGPAPTVVSFLDFIDLNNIKFYKTGNNDWPLVRNNGSVRITNNNNCTPRPAGLSCQTAPILNASEFPYYNILPISNTQTVPTNGSVCTMLIENNHWLSFVASSTSLSLKLRASNCNNGPTGNGNGLQFAVYETTNCTTFEKVFCSQSGTIPDTESTFDLMGLTIGKQYYLMIDGSTNDVCTYTIAIASGQVYNSTQAIPAQTVTGPAMLCSNRTGLTYSIPSVSGAESYIWRIPSSATATTPTSGATRTSIDVNWGSVSDSVCVRIAARCDTTKWSCKFVKVGTPVTNEITVTKCPNIPFVFKGQNLLAAGDYRDTLTGFSGCDSIVLLKLRSLPPVTGEVTVSKCADASYLFNGQNLFIADDYKDTLIAANGCDSILTLHLLNYPLSSKNIDTTICAGSSVIVGGRAFSIPNTYTVVVPRGSSLGCDSTINLKLTVIDFLFPALTKNNDITCETPEAILTGRITNQPINAQVAYDWKNSSNVTVGTNPSVSVRQSGTFTLKVTVSLNGQSCSKTNTITVTKSGNLPSKPTIAGQNLSCDGRNEVFIIPTPAANATSHNWTVTNGTFTVQTNQITTTWNANATTSKVCLSAQNACGVSDTACISVEIGRIPTPLSITGKASVCPDEVVTYRVAAPSNTNLTWVVTNGTAQNTLTTDSLHVRWAMSNGRLTVSPSNRCGNGAATELIVQVSTDLPDSLPIQGIATPCSNDTTTYSVANSATTTEYLWQVPTGATILRGQGTRTITVVWGSFSSNGQIFLTTKNVCQLARGVDFRINVKNATLAAPTINGSRTVCPSTQISFSTISNPNIRSYTWTVPTDAIILRGQGTDSVRINWDVAPSGQVCLDVENTCGVRQRTCINIEVRADLDSLVIAGGTLVCKDSTLRFCVPDDGNTPRFLWQIPSITGGTIVSGQGTSCINVKFASTSGTVRVIPVGGCSDGKLSRRDVVVKLPPTIVGAMSGKNIVCNNSIETYSLGSQSDITRYTWGLPTGAIFIGDSTRNTITVNFGNATSGFITVRAENECGFGNGTTMRVTIVPRPIANAGKDTAFCGVIGQLKGSSNGTTKTWGVVSKPASAIVNFAFPDRSQTSVTVSKSGTYIFRFEEANSGDCGTADSVTIIFRDLPTITMADQVCNQEATQYRVRFNMASGASPFSMGGSALGAFQSNAFLSDTIPSGTAYFFVITDNSGCKSDTVRGTKLCPCYTSAGTLKSDSLIVCFGTTGKVTPLGDAKFDSNDEADYLLHDGTSTRIGSILLRNKTGVFGFIPSVLTYNRTYYITLVAGDQRANGSVDSSKRCFSQTRGIPITFKDKFTAGLMGDTTVCRFSPAKLRFMTNQTGFYDITYRADSGTVAFALNVQNNFNINITPSVSATYKLVDVADKNGCKAQITDSARINLRPLPVANAGPDRSVCNNRIQLDAAENFAYVGKWTSLTSSVQITDPTDARTAVDNLQNGKNVFIWTVNDTACLDYAVRDTVQIFLPILPKAVNLSLITKVGVPVTGNVSESAPIGTYSVTRLTNPENGRFDLFSNGSFTYIPEPKFEGIVKFRYIICSDLCTKLCDTGEVRILIQAVKDTVKEVVVNVPNAITPNDDGKNDALVIDGVDQYPENELVIFNRWGDILFKSKPYRNDWRGTNQSGDPLPEGTYYYLLRLNTADGKILRGDMTVLR